MIGMTNGATFVYVDKNDVNKINEYKSKGYKEVEEKKDKKIKLGDL